MPLIYTLASDLINEAFLDLGAIAPGESITVAEQTDAFGRLQQIVDQLSAENLSVYTRQHGSFVPTAGVVSYTLGTAGAFVTAAAPIRVTSCESVSGNFRSPVEVLPFDAFKARAVDPLGGSTVLAKLLAADNSWPAINLQVFPTPAAGPGSLLIDYWVALTQFATVGDTLVWPAGFALALQKLLAVSLFPQYARPGNAIDILAAQAQAAKATIAKLTGDILGMQAAPPPAQAQTQ